MTTISLNFDFSGSVPETPVGQMTSAIIVSKSKHGEFCFAGYYLNRYPLEYEEPPEGAEESDDGGYLTTGWYYDNSNFEYEDCYYPVAGEVLAWARMPKAADVLAPSPSPKMEPIGFARKTNVAALRDGLQGSVFIYQNEAGDLEPIYAGSPAPEKHVKGQGDA